MSESNKPSPGKIALSILGAPLMPRPRDAITPVAGTAKRDDSPTQVQPEKQSKLTIYVGMDRPKGGIAWIGTVSVIRNPGAKADHSSGSFAYLSRYLKDPQATPLDPVHMPLRVEPFEFNSNGGLPPPLRDCLPDSWGRELIRLYCLEQNFPLPLCEAQYLLFSPHDRPGNLHFATKFVGNEPAWDHCAIRPGSIPDVAVLHEYVKCVLTLPQGAPGTKMPDEAKALMTGLGGTRPKVSLRLADGRYIAKLGNPLKDGESSNAHLEALSMAMARRCGIKVSDFALKRAGDFDILLVKRFDYKPNGARYQMVSAMTVMEASDDPFRRKNWSYTTFARELDRWSADPAADKEQLYRAMILRAMLSDCDDHPRNYSLLRTVSDEETPNGDALSSQALRETMGQWRLSPMYDCVAGLGEGKLVDYLAMDLGKLGRTISQENILSDCAAFGLERGRAQAIMIEIEETVLQQWPVLIQAMNLSAHDERLALACVAPLNERATMSPMERLMTTFPAQEQDSTSVRQRGG